MLQHQIESKNALEHIQIRLKERQLNFSDIFLRALALECERDTAILLTDTGIEKCPDIEREESNGNYVILIVRNQMPITVMFRRSNQPFTPQALRVDTVRRYSRE